MTPTGLVANTLYHYRVKSRDAAGNLAVSGDLTFTTLAPVPDTTPPSVSMTAPTAGAPVSEAITVSATAADNVGVVGVQFMLDGVALGAEDTSAPYTLSWDTYIAPNGAHTLTAVARDAAGNTTTAVAVVVTVANGTGLVGYWALDEGMGTLVTTDSSGNGHTGTLVKGPTWTIGKLGSALAFDGLTHYVNVPSTPVLNAYPLTVAVWMKTASAAGVRGIVNKYVASSYNGYQLFLSNGNLCAWYIRDSANYVYDGSGCTFNLPGYNDNLWHHIAYVVNASGSKLYVDGVQKGSLGWTGTAGPQTTTQPIHLGHYPGALGAAEYFPGVLDDVRIYKRALSATEVAMLNAADPPASDTISPTVSMTAPAADSTVAGTVTVSASAIDDVGVVGVQFKLDGANLGVEITAAPYTLTWNTLTASNGAHTLTAVAWDATGNTTTNSAVSVTVANDITPPTVSLTEPAAGSTAVGTITVSASATDNVGVVGVQFKLDGVNWGAEVTSTPYSLSWNTTLVADGVHTVAAVARDAAGNTTSTSAVSVTVANDLTPPTVSITAPADGGTVSGSAVTVSASATDNVGVVRVQFKLDGTNLKAADTVAPYKVTWNTTTASNGTHTLTAVAHDAAGNTTTSPPVSVTVFNDITPPTVSITSPLGSSTASATLTIAADVSDDVGVVGVQFKLDGVNLGVEDTTNAYSLSWNSAFATNGAHTLTAVARDAAGNTTTSPAVSVTVFNDITPPTVSITAPAAGSTVIGTVTVSASATDSVGIVGVQFKLDGVNLGAEVTAAPYTVSWNTTTAANGAHSLSAVARDTAGNVRTSSGASVTVANPTVSILAPLNGAPLYDATKVTVQVISGVGLSSIQVYSDSSLIGTVNCTTNPCSDTTLTVLWYSDGLAAGPHSLYVMVTDMYGNSSSSAPITVFK
jgi:hypothetical protein